MESQKAKLIGTEGRIAVTRGWELEEKGRLVKEYKLAVIRWILSVLGPNV